MKKLLLTAALLFALQVNAWGAVAVVQSGLCTADNMTSCTTAPMTTTTGNLFVCDAAYIVGGFVSIADSQANSYAVAVSELTHISGSFFMQQRYAENGTGSGSHTFTLTLSTAGYPTMACKEISGALTSGALDQTASNIDNTGATSHTSTATGTTAQADELLTGAGSAYSFPRTFTATGGFSTNENQSSLSTSAGLISGSLVASSTGAYSFTYTTDASTQSISYIATYKAAVAAAGAPIATRRISVD